MYFSDVGIGVTSYDNILYHFVHGPIEVVGIRGRSLTLLGWVWKVSNTIFVYESTPIIRYRLRIHIQHRKSDGTADETEKIFPLEDY